MRDPNKHFPDVQTIILLLLNLSLWNCKFCLYCKVQYHERKTGIDLRGEDLNHWELKAKKWPKTSIFLISWQQFSYKVPYHKEKTWIDFGGCDLSQIRIRDQKQVVFYLFLDNNLNKSEWNCITRCYTPKGRWGLILKVLTWTKLTYIVLQDTNWMRNLILVAPVITEILEILHFRVIT